MQFTPSQLANLNSLYAKAGEGGVLGAWLLDGSVYWAKFNEASVLAALDTRYATAAQGALASTAFGWGDHAAVGYLVAAAGDFASSAQGTNADTAFGWGDHATAGYLTAHVYLRKEILDAVGAETEFALADTPVGDVQVFHKAAAGASPLLWREGVTHDYTVSDDTITFAALGAGDEVHVYYTA